MTTETPPSVQKSKAQRKFGVVVFLDALGTKGSWKKEPIKIAETWDSFVNDVDKFLRESFDKLGIEFRFDAFSDTIIITTSNEKKDVNTLLTKTIGAIRPVFVVGIMHKIFLRGCFSVGEFFLSEKIIIGQAVDEASQYYTMPNWIGISATPSAHKIIQKIDMNSTNGVELQVYLKQYDIPLKNGIEQKGWAITIMNDLVTEAKQKLLSTEGKNYEFLRQFILEQLDKTDEIDNAFKWRNTLNFLDFTI